MAKKILIIDDDHVIVDYLQRLFTDNGYETFAAYDGLEANKVVKEIKPDLITLDLEMPKEWGPRFYRKLVQQKELKDTPVIVITGTSGGDHAIRKAVAYFTKPFEPDELMKAVEAHIC